LKVLTLNFGGNRLQMKALVSYYLWKFG